MTIYIVTKQNGGRPTSATHPLRIIVRDGIVNSVVDKYDNLHAYIRFYQQDDDCVKTFNYSDYALNLHFLVFGTGKGVGRHFDEVHPADRIDVSIRVKGGSESRVQLASNGPRDLFEQTPGGRYGEEKIVE